MENDRIARVQLHMGVTNLLTSHRLEMRLNGQALSGEVCRRKYSWLGDPYMGQGLEFELSGVWPRQGRNLLEVVLREQPARFDGNIVIEDEGDYCRVRALSGCAGWLRVQLFQVDSLNCEGIYCELVWALQQEFRWCFGPRGQVLLGRRS